MDQAKKKVVEVFIVTMKTIYAIAKAFTIFAAIVAGDYFTAAFVFFVLP